MEITSRSFPDLPAAIEELADVYGLKVIVDGTFDSISHEILTDARERRIWVNQMSRDQIESIADLKVINDLLKTHHLDDVAWKVLGGFPISYYNLKTSLGNLLSEPLSETFSVEFVGKVKKSLLCSMQVPFWHSSINTKAIVGVFRKKKMAAIPMQVLEDESKLRLDVPNALFHVSENYYVTPSTEASALAISENITDLSDFKSLLDKMINENQKKL